MRLYRYQPWCISRLTASQYEHIVKFNGSTLSQKGPIIFASAQVMGNATWASQYLSLTYLPRHIYGFNSNNYQLTDNEGNVITSENPSKFSRAWPAFGKYGGGMEILIETGNSEITGLSHDTFLDGGTFDRFHQDAILPLTKQILESIAKGTRSIFENETGVGLVKSGSPVFKWGKNKDNFTISIGIKETPDGTVLHIWGTKWRDGDSLRYICCLLEGEFQANLIGRKDLEERFENGSDPYFKEFSDKVRDIIRGLQGCEHQEFFYIDYTMPLGSIVRLP